MNKSLGNGNGLPPGGEGRPGDPGLPPHLISWQYAPVYFTQAHWGTVQP